MNSTAARQQRKRSFTLTLLAILFIIAAILGWVRAGQTLGQWSYLRSLPLTIPVWYLLATGAIEGLIGLAAAGSVWFQIPRSQPWIMAAAGLYTVLHWGEKALFSAIRSTSTNIPFEAVVTVLLLVFTWAALRSIKQETRKK
jgi:hypothetical protein